MVAPDVDTSDNRGMDGSQMGVEVWDALCVPQPAVGSSSHVVGSPVLSHLNGDVVCHEGQTLQVCLRGLRLSTR